LQDVDPNFAGGKYAVTLFPIPDDTVPASTDTSFSVSPGDGVFGDAVFDLINSPGDQDWYQIEFAAGEAYAIRAFREFRLFDAFPHVRLLDANGNVLGSQIYDLDVTRQSPLFYTAEASGIYYVSVQDIDANFAGGGFFLAAMELPDDTVLGSTATTAILTSGVVALGEAVSGFVDRPGDQDWYRIELTADHSYRFAFGPTTQLPAHPLVRASKAPRPNLPLSRDSRLPLGTRCPVSPSRRRLGRRTSRLPKGRDSDSAAAALRQSFQVGSFNPATSP
jgi:hypothetical protein